MKITRRQIRNIIKESLNEALPPHLQKHFRDDGSSVHAPEVKDVTPDGYGPDISKKPSYPDISHPLISPYADKMPSVMKGGKGSWFKELQAYTYSPRPNNIQAKQKIVVYYLPSGEYTSAIDGSYNNTISAKPTEKGTGHHADAVSAIESALDSTVAGSTTARQLLIKVGETIDPKYSVSTWPD